MPNPVVRLGERVLRRDGKIEPQWDEAVRREVEERLAPDAARLLDYCGRSRDLWTFKTCSLRDIEPTSTIEAAP